jgi:hypothetical protein
VGGVGGIRTHDQVEMSPAQPSFLLYWNFAYGVLFKS